MIIVNGKTTVAMGTVLDVCRRVNANVPGFCSDARLPKGGHCRACLVEVDGRIAASCTVAAVDGMVIKTQTPALQEYRQDLGELMASEATPHGAVEEALQSWAVTGQRYPKDTRRAQHPATQHPYLRFDLEACIRCQLCVRACADIQGQFVFAMQGRGPTTTLGFGPKPFEQTDCVSCGACAAVCPSGA